MVESARTGDVRSQVVALGTEYPARLFGIDPAAPSMSLRTGAYGDDLLSFTAPGIHIESVCGTSQNGDGAAPTNAMEYSPNDNVYDESPTVLYGNTATYR